MTRTIATLAIAATATMMLNMSSANAAADCKFLHTKGNQYRALLIKALNPHVRQTHRISKRKTFKVHNLTKLYFNGCRFVAHARVTLQRKIRRNAHGTVVLQGVVTELRLPKFCWSNLRVQRLKLSRTTKVGEAVYSRRAQKSLTRRACVVAR